MVHELLRILAGYKDLTHVGHVEHSYIMSHGVVFVDDAAVLYGHVVACKRTHLRSRPDMKVVKTSLLQLFFHFLNY